jgi:hypothetical protein
LALFEADQVRRVVLGPDIQQFVSTYPIFAEVINTEILADTSGYLAAYDVYSRGKLTYSETGLSEVDPFLLRAARVSATIRVGTRLLNYIGSRLKTIEVSDKASLEAREVYYTMTPEDLSLAVDHVRELKGTLGREAKRALAKDIVALAADMTAIRAGVEQADSLVVEGDNLKRLLTSQSYAAELERRDSGKAKILPEIVSNVSGAIAGVRAASTDGKAITRNAKAWMVYLADALQ